MSKRLIPWVVAAVALAGCSSPAGGPIPPVSKPVEKAESPLLAKALTGDPLGVTIHKLSNGLTVMISPEPSEPRVSAWIAFRSGSRHDPADSTGLAHYLEHMLFKGSASLGTADVSKEDVHLNKIAELYDRLKTAPAAQRPAILSAIDKENAASATYSIPNELDQLYAELGVSGVNAFTGEDMTVYIADVPSNRFEAWARVEGDRYQSPRFRLFYPELETVYEEKNRSLDNPRSQIYHEMMRALFPEHPYGTQPTIGTVEHLKTPAYGDMVRYFDKWYVPGNAAIVLSGDITPERALPALEKYFASWTAKVVPEPKAAKLPALTSRVEKTVTAPGEESVTIAWQTVPAGHPDELALEVLDLLVDNASTGMMNLDLLLTQQLPKGGSSPDFMNEAGYWQLRGTNRAGQTHQQVESLLMRIVRKLKTGTFSQRDIDAILVNAEIKAKREQESRRSRVSKMAFAFIQGRPWKDVASRLERLRAIKKDDVVRVANRYLGDGRVVVLRKRGKVDLPKIPKPKITAISVKTGRRSTFAKEIAAMPATPVEPKFLTRGTDYQVAGNKGISTITTPNKLNDLFQVSYAFDQGYRNSKLICLALKVLESSGAGDMSAEALKRRLYGLGTDIRTRCELDRVTITLSGIDRNLEKSVGLLKRLLDETRFDDKLLSDVIRNQISQRKDSVNDPRFLASATAEYAAYGPNSRFLQEPSNARLRKTRPDGVRATLKSLTKVTHTVIYFGQRESSRASKATHLGYAVTAQGAPPPKTFRKIKRSQVFATPQKVAQSNISIFFPAAIKGLADELWADIYSEYTGGGMGALIFQEIREARGLAYSATGYLQTGARVGDEAAVRGRLGTQTDKTVQALSKMLELLPVPPIREKRFELAKASLARRVRSSRTSPRSVGWKILGFRDKGYEDDPWRTLWPLLEKADAQGLRSFIKKVTSKAAIISIVTDPERLKLNTLKRFGKVIKLKPSQLVSYDDK